MQRLLINDMLKWKDKPKRKPLLLDGARQTGKSYLLSKLFSEHFTQTVRLDFLEQPHLASLFEDSLNPTQIIHNIELEFNLTIDINHTLVIFDEIGECQSAVNSLKFFAEQLPNAFICASGSNIGLLDHFPVGKVEFFELFPFTFEEFLWASNQPALLKAYNSLSLNQTAHKKLFELLLDYYFVGGMPEAVNTWFNSGSTSIITKTEQVSQIHKDLISGYERDFGKYGNKISATHIQAIFRNVPIQLSQNIDDSVKRFKFKDVINNKTRYQALSGPIDWLVKCKLLSKSHPIDSQPHAPLSALSKDNIFKLFFFDIGLLGHLLGLTYKEHLTQNFNYKGFIAENFVQNERIATGINPSYSWEYARSEIECLEKLENGEIIPIEVKSGKRTRAKSLMVYKQRYNPSLTIKLVGTSGSIEDKHNLVLPIYYAAKLPKFYEQANTELEILANE